MIFPFGIVVPDPGTDVAYGAFAPFWCYFLVHHYALAPLHLLNSQLNQLLEI
jgi:hypothetical protein